MFSNRNVITIGALAAGLALSAAPAHAQEIEMADPMPAPTAVGEGGQKGTLGLSLPVTLVSNVGSAVLSGGTEERIPTIDIVYFTSDKAAVDIIVGVNFHRRTQDVGAGMTETTNLFGFAAGLGYRMYRSKNNLRSFVQPQVVLSWADTAESDSFAINAGGAFGVERNLTPWFSFSGSAGASLNFTQSFEDIQLITQANLAANLYWK